jgi:hypothetical protein
MQWIRSHLSFANVISVMALFVALGGASYAAVTLPKNSVGAKQIKKNAVRAGEVKRNAVGASELRANAVGTGDIADNGVGGADLADNSVGAAELTDNSVFGGELAANSVGSSDLADNSVGASELADNSVGSGEVIDNSLGENDLQAGLLDVNVSVTVQRTDVALADNTTQAVEASCLAGSTAIGGGSSVDQTGSDDIKLLVSRPGNGGFIPNDGQSFNDWRAVYRNPTGGTGAAEIRAFVICVEIP